MKIVSESRINKIKKSINTIAAYYLAGILFMYGIDKIFKAQFYLPEPNLLYTPLGKLDKDILFWSTMGSSRSYSIFMGLMEIIPALLLFFNRTRLVGGIIATGVLLNVVAINFGFDISVKLLSTFLLLIAIHISWPGIILIYKSIILKTNEINTPIFSKENKLNYSFLLKSAFVTLIFFESLFPYLKSGNFNDDIAERPFLHGAYEVTSFSNQNDSMIQNSIPFKRFFVHRDGYLIFQDKEDIMTDYKLSISKSNNQLQLTDYAGNKQLLRYKFNENERTLLIFQNDPKNKVVIKTKMLNWKKLPLLQNQFHWSVD